MLRTYTELVRFPTFEERFKYLSLGEIVGKSTFGFDRYLNQAFYRSKEWRRVRDAVMIRDGFKDYVCDLGDVDHPISGIVVIHHMNPISVEDLEQSRDIVFDPEFLIAASDLTHKAIHYGDFDLLPKPWQARQPGDTKLW